MRVLTLIGPCVIAMAFCGCLIPEGRRVVSGHEYSSEAIAFLDAPGATRQETIATLGLPSWESKDSKVLLYLWDSALKWRFVPPENWSKLGIGESESETKEERWALLIAYDDAGTVTAHAVRRIGKVALEDACVSWSRELNDRH